MAYIVVTSAHVLTSVHNMLQLTVLQPSQAVTRPKARFKLALAKKSEVDVGENSSVNVKR